MTARVVHLKLCMQNPPSSGDGYTKQPVKNGCVKCAHKAKSVAVGECGPCNRGFVVRIDGKPDHAMCRTDAKLSLVGDVMLNKAIAVKPGLPIESLILLLVDEDLQAVPVVNEQNQPIGMVSKSDLVFDDYEWAELRDEAFWLKRVAELPAGFQLEGDLHLEELLASHTVKDIMSDEPLVVTERTPLVEAARQMAERKVHGCPVVNPKGTLIGMITTLDIARWAGSRDW